MPQPKKKLSKNAKAALKILEESKMLNAVKMSNESKNAVNDKPSINSPKTNIANKMRPEKKRG